MTESTDGKGYSCTLEDNVLTFNMGEWKGINQEELEEAINSYMERVDSEDVGSTVTVLSNVAAVPPEQQDIIAEQWAEKIGTLDLEKIALVSEKNVGLSIKAKAVDKADEAEIKVFEDKDKALEWAR
jgi:hypothetical protein